ncbi:MAG: MMPL family transporter [Lachnospiraceae bacterium]|jgi:predicted RND superfamily exporter protein
MKKIAAFLVNRRYIMLAIMLVLTVVCSILITMVPLNRDRTKYLAKGSNMKQGISIMESDFPETEKTAAIHVMFDDLTAEQITDVKTRLESIPNVSSVNYKAGSKEYNKENHTLFVVNTKFDYATDEELAIEAAIENGFPEYTMAYQNNDLPSTKVPIWLLLVALALAVIILLIMSHSWLDPVLFLVTIGFAIVINWGTNIILPFMDEMTATVVPILQLTLSMDYSIILMNRYRQEKDSHSNKFDAMKAALAGSFSSIASSSLTTVVGLLALVFLSFKLGPELGIMLAKGVFISMLCVFTVLPVMILWLDKWLEKTRKKAPTIHMGLLSKISYKARYVMPVIFAVFFIGSFILQRSTAINFAENGDGPLSDVFPKKNTVVVIYNNDDEEHIAGISSELEKDENVLSVLGYPNTLGKKMNAEEMYDAIKELDNETQIDEEIVRMLYFIDAEGELPTLTAAEFITFITDSVLPNETLSKHLDDDLRDNVENFKKFSDKDKLTVALTADEMAKFFDIDKKSAEQLFLYYTIQNGIADSGTMTLPTFVNFVLNTVAKDETYGAMFDAATLSSLRHMQTYTNKDTVQTERTASDLAAMLGIDENTVKTVFVLYNAGDVSDKTMTISAFLSFLCDHLMNDATFSTYFDNSAKTQMQTLNALIQLAVSKQSLSVEQMAQTLGMEEENVSGLYYLYFSTDPAFQQEVAAVTMPLGNFLELLKANATGNQLAQLAQIEQLINLAVSGQPLDAATMASITGMDVNDVAGIYMMNMTEAMTLPDFLEAALLLAPENAELQKLNQIVQLALSGAALDAATLAPIFGIDVVQVYRLFGLTLSSQKNVALGDFTGFLVNSVLTDEAYAGSFTKEQAAQLQQMNNIIQLAMSDTPLDAAAFAHIFDTDADMITTVFRLFFGADISDTTMSLRTFADFILSDAFTSDMMNQASLEQLRFLQSIMNASVNGTAFTSARLADFLGMDPSKAEQLYILFISKNGGGASWRLSPQMFVSFAVKEVLGNKDFEKYLDEHSADDLRRGHTLIEAVVSGKAYTFSEMYELLMSLTDNVSENKIEVIYLYYGGINNVSIDKKMTLPQFLTFLSDELMNDERFVDYFDKDTKTDVLNSKADLNDAIARMKSDTYSRFIITSDYADESPETYAYIEKLNELCESSLNEFYLVGNSVMVSEIEETFDSEYLRITLITAISIFVVVLLAFRNPTMPLILTLVVQCGVFITGTVIGVLSGSAYYLSLLIVQSILMGATIDYGIVFCNYYRESRESNGCMESLKMAYEGSIHTIMTSGSILVVVLGILGFLSSSAMISDVCITLSIGVFIAILLILFVLPSLVACCDRLIFRKKAR